MTTVMLGLINVLVLTIGSRYGFYALIGSTLITRTTTQRVEFTVSEDGSTSVAVESLIIEVQGTQYVSKDTRDLQVKCVWNFEKPPLLSVPTSSWIAGEYSHDTSSN